MKFDPDFCWLMDWGIGVTVSSPSTRMPPKSATVLPLRSGDTGTKSLTTGRADGQLQDREFSIHAFMLILGSTLGI